MSSWVSLPFFILGVIFIGGMIDKQELSTEVIDMMVLNGLSEPWLMSLLNRVIMQMQDYHRGIGVTFGLSDDNEFVSLEIGLLHNIFEIDFPHLNYYLMGGSTDFYDRVCSIDMEVALREGEFEKSLDYLMKYVSIQMDMDKLLERDGDFEKRISEL